MIARALDPGLRGITESPQGDGFDPDFETLFAKELKRRGLEGSSSDSESKASTSGRHSARKGGSHPLLRPMILLPGRSRVARMLHACIRE